MKHDQETHMAMTPVLRSRGMAVAAVAFAVAVLAGYYAAGSGLVPALTPVVTPAVTLAAGAVAAGGLVGWVLLRRRTDTAETDATLDHVTDLDLDLVLTDEEPRTVESLALRTLRAQVRTLEQALEQEQRLTAETPAPAAGSGVADFRRDVLLTIRALGARTEADETSRHTLARLAAAVERLDAGESFTRPVLAPAATLLSAGSAGQGGRNEAPAAVAPLASVTHAAVPVASTPQDTLDASDASDASDTMVLDPVVDTVADDTLADHPAPTQVLSAPGALSDDFAPAPAQPDVVLPVPPMVTAGDSQRGRRWFRRSAA